MRSIESTGRSIDEAIFNGLQQLEVSIDAVDIEILQQESKGILGFGARPAKVRLTEREPEEIVIPDYLNEPARPPRERRERRDRGRGGRQRQREAGEGRGIPTGSIIAVSIPIGKTKYLRKMLSYKLSPLG